MSRIIPLLRDAKWLHRERIIAYGIILLVIQTILLLYPILYQFCMTGIFSSLGPRDFLVFYIAGRQADAHLAPQIYNLADSFKAQGAIVGHQPAEGWEFFFLYPPVFILACTVLGTVSYPVAFGLWNAATLTFLAAVLRAITRDGRVVLALLSFPTILLTLGIGQNALLTAALLGAGTYLVEDSPLLAGCLLGALCYKPHYFLIVPVALLAARKWRVLAALCATVAGLCAASVLAFHWQTWQAFLSFEPFIVKHSADGSWGYWTYASWYASVRLAGGPPALALVVQGVAIVVAELLTAIVWYRRSSLAARAATLTAATLVAAPVMVSYDLTMAIIAVAWIYWDARRTGYLPWEKSILAANWILALFGRNLGETLDFPLMPLIGISLLFLGFRRSRTSGPSLSHAAAEML